MNILHRKQKEKSLRGIFKVSVRLVAFMALFLMPTQVLAVTQQDLNNKNQELQNARNSLNQTTEQRKTLQGEVANYNSQINSIEGQIAATNSEIARLKGEISTTNDQIAQKEAELSKTRGQLSEIVRVMYEDGQVTNIELIAKSKNFSEFVNRSEYIETMQLKVKDVTDKIIGLKTELESKKKSLEDAKKKSEELKNQQQAQRQQVAVQRSAKDQLLQETKGDEAAYQALVKKIQADYAYLQNLLWSQNNSGNYVSLGHVNAGDIVGYIGNSGFSTGCHLHFEIRTQSQQATNPAAYYGNGYFNNPVPGVWVSAPFGYSNAYFPGVFHSGIDYADGCAGTPIRATAEGDIIERVTGRPNTYAWSLEYGNYVKIRHTNGMYSLYGHMR